MTVQTIYISCLLILISDSTNVKKEANQTNCEYIHKQNKQCIKNLNVKWQIIEKLIQQKINNKK